MLFVTNCLIILGSFILALILTAWLRPALARRALDRPNERSSHTTPVPRGGGWALLAVLIPGMIATSFFQQNLIEHAGLIIGTLVLALVSWLDDRKGVSVHMRLSAHILAACLGTIVLPPQDLIFGGALPFTYDRILLILGWVWFMNLYNFMDGIDGITGAETVALSVGVSLMMTMTGIDHPFIAILTLLLTGTSLGFLVFNWHPAKIFLGDAGSVPLGYLTGFALIMLAVHGHLGLALILPLYYLADSGITLVKRLLRGEKIWQAHRQHFYQYAAQAFGRHDKVVVAITLANILLIGAAALSLTNRPAGWTAAFAIIAVLLTALHKRAAAKS